MSFFRAENRGYLFENSKLGIIGAIETARGQAIPHRQLPRPKQQKPPWLRIRLPNNTETIQQLKATAQNLSLATVCQEARCPNLHECWSGGTATFMVMGDTCTRGCRFCSVKTGNPAGLLDAEEPDKLADVVTAMGWDYVVITSVDRDDLPDGGAQHIARCVEAIYQKAPKTIVEVLIPDFQGDQDALKMVIGSSPSLAVVAQNIETVERLTQTVRDRRAGYGQTLNLLRQVKMFQPALYTKSSIMLGLGETAEEVKQCLKDLRAYGVDIVTLGQYLQPTSAQLPVQQFITPALFQQWQQFAEKELGFLYCAAGPLVRSSYRAGELFVKNILLHR
jgi:lipoyl synthase